MLLGLTTMTITDIIDTTSRINVEDTDIFRTGFVLSTKYSVEFVGQFVELFVSSRVSPCSH